MKTKHRGFTVLEILVVLAITSILFALLTQGLTHLLGMRARFTEAVSAHRIDRLRESWFYETVSALTLTLPAREPILEGGPHEFQGLSTAPLRNTTGAPALIAWRLKPSADGRTLEYDEPDQTRPWPIMHTDAQTRFRYRDADGAWHDHWPPKAQTAPRLPDLIELTSAVPQHPIRWLAPIRGQKTQRAELYNEF